MIEKSRFFQAILIAFTAAALWASSASALIQEDDAGEDDASQDAAGDQGGQTSVLDAVRRLREREREVRGPIEEDEPAQAQFIDADDLPPLLQVTPTDENFSDGLSARRAALASVEESERGDAALELAKFYYAWGLYHEARAAIEYMEEVSFDALFDQEAQLLSEAALVAAGRGRGENTLQLGILSALGHPDAVMWAGVVSAREGDWRTAALLGRGGGVERAAAYDWPMNASIAAVFAEALVEIGAPNEADRVISRFQPEDLRLASAGRPENYPDGPAALLRAKGRLEESRARYQAALAAYDAASEGRDYNAHDAKFRAVNLRYDLGLIDAREAFDAINELSYAWRGDDLEARALFKLADIREEQGRPDLALRPLASASARFRNSSVADEADQRLERVMRRIFVEGDGPGDPIVRLDLYERYRRALGDAEGWEVIDAAVVNFLDDLQLTNAAYSVARRMEARTIGRYQAATYLLAARKHLDNGRPQRALESLSAAELALAGDEDDETGVDRESPLGGRGVTIRARALDAIGRTDQAYEMLEENGSAIALYTLAQMSWEKSDWRRAADAYRDARLADPDVQPSDEHLARERIAKFLSQQAGVAPPRPDDEPWRDVVAGLFGPVDPPLLNVDELSEGGGDAAGDRQEIGPAEAAAAADLGLGAPGEPPEIIVDDAEGGLTLGLPPELLSEINPELLAAVEAERAARRRLSDQVAQGVDQSSSIAPGTQAIAQRLRAQELESSLVEIDAFIATAERLVAGDYPAAGGDTGDESE